MKNLIDEELKAEAARIFLGAARRRAQELAETPFGRMLKDCVRESHRIRVEEEREATPTDFVEAMLRFVAEERKRPK